MISPAPTDRTIRRRTVVIPLALLLVCLSLTVAVSAIRYTGTLEREKASTARAVAVAALQFDLLLQSIELATEQLRERLVADAGPAPVESALATLRRSVPSLRTLLVLNPAGTVIHDMRLKSPAVGIDVSDRHYFKSAIIRPDRQFSVSPPVQSRVDGTWTYPFSKPVRSDNGDLVGVIVLSMERSFFEPLWRPLEPENGITFDLVDLDANVTARLTGQAPNSKPDVDLGALIMNLTDERDGRIASAQVVDQQKAHFYAQVLPDFDFGVLGRRPMAELHYNAMQSALPLFWPGVAFSWLLGLSAFLIRRRGDALAAANASLITYAKSVPGAAFLYQRQPGVPDQITFLNEQCIDIFGELPEAIAGDPQPIWDRVNKEDAARMNGTVAESYESKQLWVEEFRYHPKPGETIWLYARGQPVDLGRDGVQWISLLIDITARKQAEEALAESREMLRESQKMEAIGQLSGGMAHDFNNLLSVILGNLDLLRTQVTGAQARQAVALVTRAAEQGADLVQQMLAFSRRSKMAPELLQVEQVVSETTAWAKRLLPANISVSISTPMGLRPIFSDRAAFTNALLNLIVNARDAIDDGGTISITATDWTLHGKGPKDLIGELEPGDYVTVSVTDTGSGIAPEIRERIFEPFFTTKSVGKGTGLGLSGVFGFVTQSRGALRVETAVGEGTTITIIIPAYKADGTGTVSADG